MGERISIDKVPKVAFVRAKAVALTPNEANEPCRECHYERNPTNREGCPGLPQAATSHDRPSRASSGQ